MDASCIAWMQAVNQAAALGADLRSESSYLHLTCFALTLSTPDVITDMASSLCHAAAGAVINDTQGTEDPDQRHYR